jgi:hypothetical protein
MRGSAYLATRPHSTRSVFYSWPDYMRWIGRPSALLAAAGISAAIRRVKQWLRAAVLLVDRVVAPETPKPRSERIPNRRFEKIKSCRRQRSGDGNAQLHVMGDQCSRLLDYRTNLRDLAALHLSSSGHEPPPNGAANAYETGALDLVALGCQLGANCRIRSSRGGSQVIEFATGMGGRAV